MKEAYKYPKNIRISSYYNKLKKLDTRKIIPIPNWCWDIHRSNV